MSIEKIFTIATSILLIIFFSIAFLIFSSIFFLPEDSEFYAVKSGSMEPIVNVGNLIFVEPQRDYYVGDIVTRKVEGTTMTITHRIIGKNKINGEVIFKTKGDANNFPDLEEVKYESIIGKAQFQIPYFGYPINYVHTQKGLILFILIPSIIIIYKEIFNIVQEINRISKVKLNADIELND